MSSYVCIVGCYYVSYYGMLRLQSDVQNDGAPIDEGRVQHCATVSAPIADEGRVQHCATVSAPIDEGRVQRWCSEGGGDQTAHAAHA